MAQFKFKIDQLKRKSVPQRRTEFFSWDFTLFRGMKLYFLSIFTKNRDSHNELDNFLQWGFAPCVVHAPNTFFESSIAQKMRLSNLIGINIIDKLSLKLKS